MAAVAPSAPPPLNDAEYKKLYDLINNEVHLAIHSFYQWLEINKWMAQSLENREKLNAESIFWMTQLNGLQTAYFIVLGGYSIKTHKPIPSISC